MYASMLPTAAVAGKARAGIICGDLRLLSSASGSGRSRCGEHPVAAFPDSQLTVFGGRHVHRREAPVCRASRRVDRHGNRRRSLNLIAPVARSIFIHNHTLVMVQGGEELARLLGSLLLSQENIDLLAAFDSRRSQLAGAG
jgi:hypothetical protein